jgi:hypothetical protein
VGGADQQGYRQQEALATGPRDRALQQKGVPRQGILHTRVSLFAVRVVAIFDFCYFAKYEISAKVNLISRNFVHSLSLNFVTKISRNFVEISSIHFC